MTSTRPTKQVTARSSHEIPAREPLRLAAGDRVEAGERSPDWPEFVFVTAAHGTGWVPARHLSGPSGSVRVEIPYDTTELPTAAGDTLEVVAEDRASGWLWCRNSDGREGWVPVSSLMTDR
ncbi:SH3 domain-containing protein [Streptomyces sp. NPDC052114]|uniref:SH3 domain-containing protein n=1 Tax=unclassified Streptomyces TaxID=2593676 RepID=UPI003431A377